MILVIAALLSWVGVGAFKALARARGWGQRVRLDGPQGHIKKEGTPTMGGVAFTVVILAVWLVAVGLRGGADQKGWAVAGLVAGMAVIGFVDDVLLVRSRLMGGERGGLKAREKFPLQFAVAIPFALVVARNLSTTGHTWSDVVLYAIAAVGAANAVNFTDGLDGLAASVVAVMLVPFVGLSPLAAITIGGMGGYLWHNVRPASIFMGDAGSHALGAIVAGVFITQGWMWVLPIAALIPVLEILSVVAQVAYFRATHGRRLLRMAPLHHHFEKLGWDESRITGRFTVVTAVATAAAWAIRTGLA
ncbi:MAG TPA: phospho-N-acetylmuramoyl-pentapeptide-transferase [Deinococcales bacterium]|nr:phospho-N-acetylmuramoyl-pentapeptide-transferase [Deinococcales bacterium]